MSTMQRCWKWVRGFLDPEERKRRQKEKKIKEMADFLERNRQVDSNEKSKS